MKFHENYIVVLFHMNYNSMDEFLKVLNFYTPSSLSCFIHGSNDLFQHNLVDMEHVEGAIKHKK